MAPFRPIHLPVRQPSRRGSLLAYPVIYPTIQTPRLFSLFSGAHLPTLCMACCPSDLMHGMLLLLLRMFEPQTSSRANTCFMIPASSDSFTAVLIVRCIETTQLSCVTLPRDCASCAPPSAARVAGEQPFWQRHSAAAAS
eukprot:3690249-Pleurochrysis_carterae.AAC.1